MTLFHLVRHGAHGVLDRVLTGRRMDLSLSDEGRVQVEALACWFDGRSITAVLASPLARTIETAQPIAKRRGIDLRHDSRLLEIDFGDWAGENFANLDARDDWKRWNSFRSGSRAAGGETMVDAQARIVTAMQELRDTWPDGEVVLVSHGDMVKAAIAYWLGVSLDLFQRIEISPASISQVRLGQGEVTVLGVNQTTGRRA